MYQSLYRKYRPQNFDEVIGQQVIVKTLKNTITNQRLSHAYLFTGPRGTGKTSIAKIFAKTIDCSDLKGTNPCNTCESCIQILNKQSVDIVEIDAASNNGVDEIRELRSKANLVPTIGKYKVYIIDEVHMLTTGAFNALLKTLEEPPSHIIFILATTEPHKIPATIISRCQRFDFKKISKENMVTGLKIIAEKEKIVVEENAYEEIARQSDGCMRDALSIFDQVIAFSDDKITIENVHEINGTLPESQLISMVENIKNKKYEQIFCLIEEYDNLGKNYIKLSEDLIHTLRNILLYIHIPNYECDGMNKNLYTNIISTSSVNEVMHFIQTINNYLFEMKKTNNPRIIFEMMIISLIQKNEDTIMDKDGMKIPEEKKELFVTQKIEKKEIQEESKLQEFVSNEHIELKKPILQDSLQSIEFTKKEEQVEKQEVDHSKFLKKIKELQNIRINNALYAFNKSTMIEFKNKIEDVRNLLVDSEYSAYASIILDSEIKVASDNHIVFLCKNKRMETEFLKNLLQIDKTLEKIYTKKIFSVPVNEEDWVVIKNEFNNKLKKYEYLEEPQDIQKYFENNQNTLSTIDKLFGDIVEYS